MSNYVDQYLSLSASKAEFERISTERGHTVASHLLFYWLSNDKKRAELYKDLVSNKEILKFQSRALVDDGEDWDENRPKTYRQSAFLVVHPDHVDRAYKDAATEPIGQNSWGHAPYSELGGTFMLALDERSGSDAFQSHDRQRDYCVQHLNNIQGWFDPIATVAFKAGASLALKGREFDLADVAESVAVSYVALLFGFSQADLPLLKRSAPKIGKGLMYVNVGRHFFTDALAIREAKEALAAISQRAAHLIDVYDCPVGQDQIDERKDLEVEAQALSQYWFEDQGGTSASKVQRLEKFQPMMRAMGLEQHSPFSTTEKAILVAGLVSGTITNMRAAVCIAVEHYFAQSAQDQRQTRDAARDIWLTHRDAIWEKQNFPALKEFQTFIEDALIANPPPPFVPRRAEVALDLGNNQRIPKGAQIVIAVGGGSWKSRSANSIPAACPFSKVFGGPPEAMQAKGRATYLHSCIGKNLAMYSLSYTIRQLLLLPGLTPGLDEKTGKPFGVTKTAGFLCERYPMQYEREKLLRQSPLQTVLHVKNPVSFHAEALKEVLKFGAPFIEKVLREARHVHFASFLFMDNDSKLLLFTAFDGDYDSYIGHFAHEFGPLFDRFFSHIENGPPTPIAEHAFEFVQFLRRFRQPAVGGLFFSAYPEAEAHAISAQFNPNRDFDFLTMEGKP